VPFVVLPPNLRHNACSSASGYHYVRIRQRRRSPLRGAIPHRRTPEDASRSFLLAEVDAWENGAELDVVELPRSDGSCRRRGVS
jgi:hypothetical protein